MDKTNKRFGLFYFSSKLESCRRSFVKKNKIFSSLNFLKITMEADPSNLWTCVKCLKYYKTKENFEKHEKSRHSYAYSLSLKAKEFGLMVRQAHIFVIETAQGNNSFLTWQIL